MVSDRGAGEEGGEGRNIQGERVQKKPEGSPVTETTPVLISPSGSCISRNYFLFHFCTFKRLFFIHTFIGLIKKFLS